MTEKPREALSIERRLCQVLTGQANTLDWQSLQPADWSALQATAQREGVAPLLYWYLKEPGEAAAWMPTGWLEVLRANYYATLARNTLHFSSLWKILEGLHHQRIPVLLLKGASLAHACYPNIGLRPMGDLDMLFHQGDVASASQVLRQAGLQPVVMEDESNPENLSIYCQPFVRDQPPVHIELHWNLFGRPTHRYEPDTGWVWENSQEFQFPRGVKVQMGDVRVMSPSLNFLYMCAHLVIKHRGAGERLLWYMDLFQLQTTYPLDWQWIAEAAERCHWTAGLHACLEKLERDFFVELPSGYLEWVEQTIPDQDRQYLQARGQIEKNWQQMNAALAPLRLVDRTRFLITATFPSPDYMRWRYQPSPTWLWPLMYPYRWLRAVQKLVFNTPDTPPPTAKKT